MGGVKFVIDCEYRAFTRKVHLMMFAVLFSEFDPYGNGNLSDNIICSVSAW